VFDRQRLFVPFRLGQGSMLFVVMLFALSALSLEFSRWWEAIGGAAGFILARLAAKTIGVLLLARPSALSLRKASLLGLGLTPMSALGLALFLDVAKIYPEVTSELGATMHVAIALLALLGPLATQFAIRRAAEAG
jgi:hypothetical protein